MNLDKYIEQNVKIENIDEFKDDKYELAIIRLVLKETAHIFYRDYTFFLDKENLKARNGIYNKKFDIKKIDKTTAIVCKSYCEIIKEVLIKRFHLDVELISPDNDKFKHIDLLIKTKKGNLYIISPLTDLIEMKVGMKTKNFASKYRCKNIYAGKLNNVSYLTDEELKEIDDKIHYTIYGMYVDDILEIIKQEFDTIKNVLLEDKDLSLKLLGREYTGEILSKDEILSLKLRFIFTYINNVNNINGIVDLHMYYKDEIFPQLLTEDEQESIKINSFFIDRKNSSIGEARERGLIIETNTKKYIVGLQSNEYLEIEEKDWNEFIKKHNIFIKEKLPIQLLSYLKINGLDRDIVHHTEFLKMFYKFEQNLISDGHSVEDIKKFIKILPDRLLTFYGERIEYKIENYNLTVNYLDSNCKKIILFFDEGKDIRVQEQEYDFDGR